MSDEAAPWAGRSEAESGLTPGTDRLVRALEDHTAALGRAELRHVLENAVVLGRMRREARDAAEARDPSGGTGTIAATIVARPRRGRPKGSTWMTKDVIKDAIRQWRLDKGRWPIQKEIAEERGVSVDGIRVALKREDPPTDFTRLRDEVKTELKGRDSD